MKVVVVGDVFVGKTSLIQNLCSSNHPTGVNPGSLGLSRCSVIADGSEINLEIWDTAGQEAYSSLIPCYARSAEVGIIVAAIDDPNSINAIEKWRNFLTNCQFGILIFLAINKIDLGPIPYDLEKRLCQYERCCFVSALTGENVYEFFSQVAQLAAENRNIKEGVPTPIEMERKRKCCN
jgi:small GTP-binding protein